MKQPCVYLLASKRNGTLYMDVTSNLIQRIGEHKNGLVEGFTKRYGVHRLVWYEVHETMQSAIAREKAIKEWKRLWKTELIEKANPEWRDLYEELFRLDFGWIPGSISSEPSFRWKPESSSLLKRIEYRLRRTAVIAGIVLIGHAAAGDLACSAPTRRAGRALSAPRCSSP